jgi:acyl carrier protein
VGLQEELTGGLGGYAMASEIREKLLDFISQQFRIPKDDIDPDTSLVDQGVIDSFGFVEIVSFLEAQLPIVIADEQINRDHFGSVNRIVAFVTAAADAASRTREPPLVH